MKYQAVIFDLFGTLVDEYDTLEYASALRETSSILKLRHEDFQKLWHETSWRRNAGGFENIEENLQYICRELNEPVKQFDIKLAKMVRYDFLSPLLTPRLYTVETLSMLKKAGYKLGLISNCSIDIPDIWPRTPLAPFFDVTVFSCNCGLMKPDPAIYRPATGKLGVKPEDCLFVDDNADNLAAAASLGMKAVLIEDPGEKDPYRPKEQQPKEWTGLKIKDLLEVVDMLEEQHEI